MKRKDLLSIADLSTGDVWRLLHLALELKREPKPLLAGRVLALLFEKPSLRTRVSFDVAMEQLGGHAIYLSPEEVGLGRREAVADAARTLGRFVHGIVLRSFAQSTLEELARAASVPVINGLTDYEHPCQALGDLLTIYEKRGRLKGLTLAYIGDGNNVARSLALGASLVEMEFLQAAPRKYRLEEAVLSRFPGNKKRVLRDPGRAVRGADVVYTDVWVSMGQEKEKEARLKAFQGYQVTPSLLDKAEEGVLFMHPLPAHHGEEVSPGLLEDPRSVVFDQAENRLHIQKAILAELLGR